LITPCKLQTNGMIEHFNGRIADVLRTNRFDSSASLQVTSKRFVYLYNQHIPQQRFTPPYAPTDPQTMVRITAKAFQKNSA